MSKKYKVIEHKDVLTLIKDKGYITKNDIVIGLQTSLYQVLRIIDDLVDDNKIELVEVDSKFNVPVLRYSIKVKK